MSKSTNQKHDVGADPQALADAIDRHSVWCYAVIHHPDGNLVTNASDRPALRAGVRRQMQELARNNDALHITADLYFGLPMHLEDEKLYGIRRDSDSFAYFLNSHGGDVEFNDVPSGAGSGRLTVAPGDVGTVLAPRTQSPGAWQ